MGVLLVLAVLLGPFVAMAVWRRRVWWVPGAAVIAFAIVWLIMPHEGRRTIGEAGPDVGILFEYAIVIASGVVWLVVLLVGASKRRSKRSSSR